MAGHMQLVAAYLLGGLTFLPLLLSAVFLHGYFFLSRSSLGHESPLPFEERSHDHGRELNEKLHGHHHEPDVAAGYFAVCREFVPGGVNGKPPERTTPAGETIAAESPSVYQSMYRSIFDRNKTQTPTIESGKPVKKARNVFYIVLRHGHLVLFDNAEQLEVRHVISLAFYHVDIHAGGEEIPEGELYIKRNCIRLTKTTPPSGDTVSSAPFYLFSDNCSEKEDFYHAILHSQAPTNDVRNGHPLTQIFDTEDMIKLVRTLHLSDDSAQLRWLNALLGRLFLGLYKTLDLESHIRTKIEKKISRVSKPAFITSLSLQHIDMGDSAPTLLNAKLKEITVDGNVIVEADVRYTGCFKVVISAVARIELGSRFKPRNVTLVLATILKRLEGHVLIRIKPPPSNRIWMSFESAPKLELSVEPIVSSRQITYGVILRAIESRIREVLTETLVFPNADDFPFFNTENQQHRGGIWQRTESSTMEKTLQTMEEHHEDEDIAHDHILADLKDEDLTVEEDMAKVTNMPQIPPSPLPDHQDFSTTSSKSEQPASDPLPLLSQSAIPPKSMRPSSFAAAASPVVTTDAPGVGDGARVIQKTKQRATKAMKELSLRSRETSPTSSPKLPPRTGPKSPTSTATPNMSEPVEQGYAQRSTPSLLDLADDHEARNINEVELHTGQDGVARSISQRSSDTSSLNAYESKLTPGERKAIINQSINSATTAAKKWGMGVLNRQQDWKKTVSSTSTKEEMRQPYGRGQPLPPPGTPLPRPATGSWSAVTLNALRRKPAFSELQNSHQEVPQLPPRPSTESEHVDPSAVEAAPALPTRSTEHYLVPSNDEVHGHLANKDVVAPSSPEQSGNLHLVATSTREEQPYGTVDPTGDSGHAEAVREHDVLDDSAWLVDDDDRIYDEQEEPSAHAH